MPETFSPVAPVLTARSLPSAFRHVLSNWGGFACSSIVTFFLSPFLVHHLGNSAYGLWILIASLTGYLGLLNLGVGSALTRFVAWFHAEANDKEASAVASSALGIFLVVGTIVALASPMFAALILLIFHIPVIDHFTVWIVVILSGFTIAFTFVGEVFSGIITALHRFDFYNIILVGQRLLSAAAIVLVLANGKGLISLALVQLSFAFAAGLVFTLVALRLYPALEIRIQQCNREYLKLIFSFSAYAFLLQLSFNLIFYTDSMIIGMFLPVKLITFFAIAGNLMHYSRGLIGGISALMTPRASALAARGDHREVQELLLKATRFATIVILPIALTFLLRGKTFIRLWMGEEYVETSGRVLAILTIALIFIAGNQVATWTMLAIRKHKLVVLVVCIEALCNLGLSVALVRPMGLSGVAWGTTLPSLAVSLVFWPWYVNHVLDIPIRKYVVSTWLRPAAAVIPFALLTYAMERFWRADNLFLFFFQIGIILPAVLLSSWRLCFNHSERATYSQRFFEPLVRTLGWS